MKKLLALLLIAALLAPCALAEEIDSKGRWFESSRVRTQKSPQNRQIMTILRAFVCDVELWMFVLFALFAQMVVKW